MTRAAIGAALGAVVAIATFATAASAQTQPVRLTLGAWPEAVMLDTMRQEHELTAKPEAVYAAVLRAFADLGIPTGRTDSKAGIIGSERFERMHVIAGGPMSRSYDCGDGATGAYADAFRLEIVVAAWVSPATRGSGTTLGLATVASGRDMSGALRTSRACASTGALETKLLDRVTKLLGG